MKYPEYVLDDLCFVFLCMDYIQQKSLQSSNSRQSRSCQKWQCNRSYQSYIHNHIRPAVFDFHCLQVHLKIHWTHACWRTLLSHQCAPIHITDIVQTTAALDRWQGLRSSTDILTYAVPQIVTKLEDHPFSVTGPTACSSLPSDIRRLPETNLFKRHLKTYF